MPTDTNIVRLVKFSELNKWDCKRYIISSVKSRFNLVKIGKHIVPQTEKIKPFDNPDKDYCILGVSNTDGMFDAYVEKGANIKQPYKIVKNGYIAYNPYRVNVGSVGLKTNNQKYDLISPAYVVFSCKETLLPEFIHLLMKTQSFNRLIRDNTTGSVRQTFSFDSLKEIKIPLPSIPEQQALLNKYNASMKKAVDAEQKADKMHDCIFHDLSDKLGIVERKAIKLNGLGTIPFSQTEKWGIDFLVSPQTTYNRKFPVCPAGNLCDIGSGGTPSRNHQDYYNGQIPWVKTGEVLDDIIVDTEEKITPEAMKNSSTVLYPVGSLIIAMYGQGKTRGKTAKLGIEATTNQACAVLHNINTEKVLVDYLWFYFQGEYNRIRTLAYGNNQPNLNAKIIKTYPVVVPPIHSDNKDDISQEKIVADIQNRKSEIQALREEAESLRQRAKKEFEEAVFG